MDHWTPTLTLLAVVFTSQNSNIVEALDLMMVYPFLQLNFLQFFWLLNGSNHRNLLYSCIFSDCLSAIQEISKPFPVNKVVCDIRHTLINIQHQGSTVFFEWIPSHSGIPGNEKVDTIAKLGTQKPNIDHCIPLSDGEIKHLYKKQLYRELE